MLSRTRLWEQRVADLKEAHEREVAALKLTIDALSEQIDYLRMTGGVPALPRTSVTGPVEHRPPMSTPPYMSEEEEDLRAMADSELLDEQQLRSALADLGIEP